MKTPKKILIITFDYPPSSGAVAVRAFNIVRFLSQKGFDTNVIYEYKIRDAIYDPISNETPSYVSLFPTLGEYKPRKIVKLLLKILPTHSYWLFKVIGYIKKTPELKSPDVIYCIGYPFISHVLGIYYKLLNWKSILVLDFVDPWSLHPGTFEEKKNRTYRIVSTIFELISFSLAKNIFFSNKYILNEYMKKYNGFVRKNKFHSFIFGFDKDSTFSNQIRKNQNFVVGFIGNIQGRQNVVPLLDALIKFCENNKAITIKWVGRFLTINSFSKMNEFKALPNVEYNEYIKNNEILNFVESNDVNILLLHNGFQTPSKLSLLLTSSKPILCIYTNLPEESVEIIYQYKKGICVFNDSERIYNNLLYIYNLWLSGDIKKVFNNDCSNSFSWNYILTEAFGSSFLKSEIC